MTDVERCDDCIRTDSAVTDLRPSQSLVIPNEALIGGAGEVGRGRARAGLTRRDALRTGLLGLASVYAASHLSWDQVWESATAEAAVGNECLVLLYMQGGADSLNMFVPIEATQYGAYQAARANIARISPEATPTENGLLALGGTGNNLGLANHFTAAFNGSTPAGVPRGFDTLYGDGLGAAGSNLAIWPAADYFPPNLSHFESRDFWFSGSLQKMTTGWVGRWLDRHGSDSNPLQAVSLSSDLSKQIRSVKAPVCAINGFNGANFSVAGLPSSINPTQEIASMTQRVGAASNPALNRSRNIFGVTTTVAQQISQLTVPATAGYPPNSFLADRLKMAATILGAGLGTRFITIDFGSFDTHGTQLATMDPQLKNMGWALSAFQADLEARGIADRVTTLVFSEFGRRVASNDGAGTDHGAGGAMFAMGTKVRGGLAGEFPGVMPGQLDPNGDLRPATDFRSVYQAIIAEWLGTDPAEILPGGPFPGIARFDGGTKFLKD